jgi:hypothetical protein
MVSSTGVSNSTLPEFFRVNGPVVNDDLLEPVNADDSVPADLVRLFRGAIRLESMRARLEEFENNVDWMDGNVLFSEEFSDRYLPSTFRHLLHRMGIVLNVCRTNTRYVSWSSREKMELRSGLTDARKNELGNIRRAFTEYAVRSVGSREVGFLVDMAIYFINDVLCDNE